MALRVWGGTVAERRNAAAAGRKYPERPVDGHNAWWPVAEPMPGLHSSSRNAL